MIKNSPFNISYYHHSDEHRMTIKKHSIMSGRLATLLQYLWGYLRRSAMACDASRILKSQENALFYLIVWPGLWPPTTPVSPKPDLS